MTKVETNIDLELTNLQFYCQNCHLEITIHDSIFHLTDEIMSNFADYLQLLPKQTQELEDIFIKFGRYRKEEEEKTNKFGYITQEEKEKMLKLERESEIIENCFEDFFVDTLRRNFGAQVTNFSQNDKEEEKEPGNTENTDKFKFQIAFKMFELICQQTGNIFPLCNECTISWYNEINKKVKDELRQKKVYRKYSDQFEKMIFIDTQTLVNTNQDYDLEIDEITKELEKLEKEEQQINKELKLIKHKEMTFQKLEKKYHRDLKKFQLIETETTQNHKSMKNKINYVQKELLKLFSTSVYNDVFHIYCDGHFGTINGFRLGRLPSLNIENEEINAALGLAALLLSVLSKQMGFKSEQYLLIPCGSFSKIAQNNDQISSYKDISKIKNYGELFLTQEGFMKKLRIKKFNQAMIWFLNYLQNFAKFAQNINQEFELPYSIKGDQINDVSVKFHNNNLINWTRAMKYLLTDLKQFMLWGSYFSKEKMKKYSNNN
ncbi:beclin-1 [Anaeramoeba flamelloides]|uniref:Beclin-1 n=1 Tax=Anaeramoeba flamelloides TaxID=1746091 RepID=A0AAV7Z6C1_9EUKA|nr:beclin-1 [Anaeramoeba flamelloides]